MRGSWKRWRLACAGGVAATLFAFWIAGAAGAASTATYVDAIGDAKSAPDLTRLVIADNGNGTLGVDIRLAASTELGSDGHIDLFINSTRSGRFDDVDYGLFADAEGVSFYHWDGTDFSPFNNQPINPTFDGTDLRFTLTLADLGVTAFDFTAIASRGNDEDDLPDSNSQANWPAVPIKAISIPHASIRPRAARQLFVPVRIRLGDGTSTEPDSVACKLAYKGHALKPVAECTWFIAKRYRGKKLVLTITAVYRGQAAQSSFTIRPH